MSERDTSQSSKGKTLFVSDFDDTLAKTDSKIYLTRDGKKIVMDPAQFATYESQPDDKFDFSEFDQLINPQPIKRFVNLIKQAASGRADKVVVLTARGHTLPVTQFLKMHNVAPGVAIAALGDSNPQQKANYIEQQISRDGYKRVAFIDDSKKNVNTVKLLRDKFPDVKILAHHATEHPKDGEPSKQIPNTAKDRVVKKPNNEPTNASPESKRNIIKKLLNSKVKNPETDNDILVKTALGYDKTHPSYKQAKGMVMAYSKKHGINIKPTR